MTELLPLKVYQFNLNPQVTNAVTFKIIFSIDIYAFHIIHSLVKIGA